MACGIKTWFIISVILNMVLVVLCKPKVPCYFIFGDSLVDNGNNNALITIAKANYQPYGIDFPDGPTGRFTNGKNIADVLAELLGFDEYIPPFATAKGIEIINGVNYGSGGGGIRDDTGRHLGDVISFNKQLQHHQITISRMDFALGSKNEAKKHLNKCLYHVGLGSNDYINNYFLPYYYQSRRLYSPDQYAELLIQQYSKQLQVLYDFGARKVVVFGVGLVGFTPAEGEINGKEAAGYINNAVELFNARLKQLIDELNTNLPHAKFILISSISTSLVDSSTIGIIVADKACCITTRVGKGQCVPGLIPCINRNDYYFFDNFHSTEKVNVGLASRAYKAELPTDAYPMDISHLIQL